MSEQGIPPEYRDHLDRFRAMLDLGRVASNMAKSIDTIHQTMDTMGHIPFTTAPDEYLDVVSVISSTPLYFEVLNKTSDSDPDELPTWSPLHPDQFNKAQSIIEDNSTQNKIRFEGRAIRYDQPQSKIWIYDGNGTVRAQFTEGVEISVKKKASSDS